MTVNFVPSRIDIEAIEVTTFGDPVYVNGPMTLHGKFIVTATNGAKFTHEAVIELTYGEVAIIQQQIDAASERYRRRMGDPLCPVELEPHGDPLDDPRSR